MGKDQEGSGIMYRDVTTTDTNGGIPSIPLDVLLDNENSYACTQERHIDGSLIQQESLCTCTKSKIDETEDSNTESPNSPIRNRCAKNKQMESSCLETSDIVVCDSSRQPCATLDNNANNILVETSIIDTLHQKDSSHWDKVDMKSTIVGSPENICKEKMDRNIFKIESISENSFYQGIKIPDISASNCLDNSRVTRDEGLFSRNSYNRRSLSPGRSPSPYSCGSTTSLREPGNISSEHFQVTWKSVSDTNIRNSATKCERECISISNVSVHHKTHDELFLGEENKIKNINIGDVRNYDEDNVSNNVDLYAISCEGKPCHPEVPVIEDSDVKRAPFSPKVLNSISRYEGCDNSAKVVVSGEQKTAQLCKNDSLVRVSHFVSVDNVFKRVIDVRTITDLMTSYSSLKNPIILPFVRQRSFYDQWARLPCGDVTNRGIYPRSSANMTIKCWTLLQAIQNDQMNQMKSNSSPSAPASGSNNRLVVPNPADVTCKSLESIIEHYNQISYAQNPIFSSCSKTPPATPLKSLGSKSSSFQSSSSRSSSGKSNEKQPSANQCSSQNTDPVGVLHAVRKCSPVPLRKKSNQKQNINKNNPPFETSRSKTIHVSEIQKNQDGDRFENKNHRDSTNIRSDSQRKPLDEPEFLETSSIPTAEFYSSGDDLKTFSFPNEDSGVNEDYPYQISRRNSNSADQNIHSDEREQQSSTAFRNEVADTQKRDVSPRLRTEKRRLFSPVKEFSRDPYDVNTRTVMLNLPHDNVPCNKNDPNEITVSLVSGEKRGTPYQNVSNTHNGMVGLARRSKTRLILHQMNPKPKHQEISLATSPLHNSHLLKQSLHINELLCSKDIDGKYHHKREKTSKTGRSRSSTSWKSSTQPPPELPTRGYSMVDRLEPSENPVGQMALSPEMFKPKSDRQSAVSLANVHFLDLTDLKTMLRKTNTPIPRL